MHSVATDPWLAESQYLEVEPLQKHARANTNGDEPINRQLNPASSAASGNPDLATGVSEPADPTGGVNDPVDPCTDGQASDFDSAAEAGEPPSPSGAPNGDSQQACHRAGLGLGSS